MKHNLKTIINISIIIIICVSVLMYVIITEGMANILSTLKQINIPWCIAGFFLITIYWLLESLCLYIVEKKMYKNQKFKDSFKVSMIGQLFNCITPFSSGGQIMQAVAMKCEGKSTSNSASILLIKFIVYQATLVMYTLVIILFQYTYFKNMVTGFVRLALIGFLVNFGVICFLVLVGFNKNFVLKLLSGIYKFLNKLHIIKDVETKITKLSESINNFNLQFKIIRKEKAMVFKLTLATAVQLTVFFAITFAVYKMFGLSGTSFIKIISAQAFLSMVMAFIPIPGAGIAAEGGFYVIFSLFFTSSTINMSILFWRFYTFYLPIIVGSAFLISMKKNNQIEMED